MLPETQTLVINGTLQPTNQAWQDDEIIMNSSILFLHSFLVL